MRSGIGTPTAGNRTLVGVLTAILAVATACGPTQTPAPSSASPGASGSPVASVSASAATGEPTRAETLIIKAYRAPDALIGNQYIASSDAFISDGVHQLVKEPLFYLNYATGESVPWLATGYEYNADNTVITVHLRDGVTWSDGEPFTADDVVYTLEQILKAKAPYRAANIQASVASAKAIDPKTVEITLKAPNPRFVQTDLSYYIYTANFIPVPKHIFEGQDFETFAFFDLAKGWPIGTGPYTIKSIGADRAFYLRDDNWWAAKTGFAALPAPRQVVYSLQGPEDSLISELASNDIDWAGHYGLTPAGAGTALGQNPKLQATLWNDPCPWALTINTKSAQWSDPQMRWALNSVIRKDQFSALFNTPSEPTPARSTFPEYGALSSLLDANASLFQTYNTLEYSLDKAAAIFEQQGYTQQDGKWVGSDGKPLTVRLSIFNAAALGAVWTNVEQLLVQDLTDAGLTVESLAGDFGVVADARTNGDFDAQTWFECGSVADPWATLNRYAGAAGTDNPGGWDNAEYNDLVAQIGSLTPTDSQAATLAGQALEIFLKELPVIPLAQRPEPHLSNTTYWTNWPTDDNAYEIPAAWVMSFHNVAIKLQPAQ